MILKKLAKLIGSKSFPLDSSQREQLHLAAVLVNNFTNHLFAEADLICEQNNLPFDLLLPLVKKKFYFIRYIEVAGGIVSDYLTPIFKKKYKVGTNSYLFLIIEINSFLIDPSTHPSFRGGVMTLL